MSPVTLDLVTIKEHFVHRAAGLSANVNKEQLVNVATGAQYARPVRPGQFSKSEDYEPVGITAPRKLLPTKDQILGCCPQVLQGKHSAPVTGSKRPGAHLSSTKCQRVTTREKTAFVWCAAVRWGPENPQPGPEHPKTVCGTRKSAFPSLILRQMWLTGSLLGWLERMATCQQMRWKCWVGNIRTVWFLFNGAWDHRQGDSNAACKTANACC